MPPRRLDAEPTRVVMKAPTQVSVGSTTTSILPANGRRAYASFFNTSLTETIWLGFGNPAVVDNGVGISPRSPYELHRAVVTEQAVNGISTSGSVNVAVQEGE